MSLDRRKSFIVGGSPAHQRKCHRRMLRYGPFWWRSHLIRLATVQPRKTTIQWITLPLSSIAMLSFLMFASLPRERHSPEWRRAAFRKTERQLSEPSALGIRSFLTLLFSADCRLFARSFALLALFFEVRFFVFCNLQTLFAKCRGGVGIPNACTGHLGWGVPLP